jgi:hypothetical protein
MSGPSDPVTDCSVEQESRHEDYKRNCDNSRNQQPIVSFPSFLEWLLNLLFHSLCDSGFPLWIMETALNNGRSP